MDEPDHSLEQTGPEWSVVAASPAFRELESRRQRITLGLLGIFVVAVGSFLVLCAYARSFMGSSVDGGLTVAYVWLLALTVLAWVLAFTFLRIAERRLEPAARAIVEQLAAEQRR